jgi:hypothetical protein
MHVTDSCWGRWVRIIWRTASERSWSYLSCRDSWFWMCPADNSLHRNWFCLFRLPLWNSCISGFIVGGCAWDLGKLLYLWVCISFGSPRKWNVWTMAWANCSEAHIICPNDSLDFMYPTNWWYVQFSTNSAASAYTLWIDWHSGYNLYAKLWSVSV